MKIKSKFWKFALGGLGVATSISTIGIALVSCSNNQSITPKFYTADPSHGNFFESVTDSSSSLTPSPSIPFADYIKSLLMNPDVSSKFFDGVANLVVLTWYKNVSNADPKSKIADTYNEWLNEIGLDPFTGNEISGAKGQGSAQKTLKEYEDKYGQNAEIFLQNEVYNTAGGSKQAWIQSLYLQKVKDQFVTNIFSGDNMLMGAKGDNSTVYQLNSNFKNKVDLPQFVNGGGASNLSTGIGQKNNFIFSADTTSYEKGSTDYNLSQGYADFLDFALDQYVANEMPLMSNMALFKPTSPMTNDTSEFFNVNYFGKDTIGTEGSYKFQCYKSSSGDQTGAIDVLGKWSGAIDQLNSKSPTYAVNTNTGVINISKNYTDDSSTYMVNDATKIFTDTVTPFASAVAYKFGTIWANNQTTGPNGIDSQVQNLDVTKIDKSNIMNNFLVFDKNSSNAANARWTNGTPTGANATELAKNYLAFPFNTHLAFQDTNYEGAVGVLDTFNVIKDDTGNKQTPFIITRNEFGVHIVGIDRYDALVAAANTSGNFSAKMSAIRNEIRNTVVYRYAKYLVNNNDTVNGFDLKTKLETYVKDNFSNLILSYLKNTPSTNNLFTNLTLGDSKSVDSISISNNISDAFASFANLKNLLNIESNIQNVKTKIYDLQDPYLNNSKPEEWTKNGIAGVLPYTRTGTNGDFKYLENIQWMTWNKISSTPTSIEQAIYNATNDFGTKITTMLTSMDDKTNSIIIEKNNPNKSSQIFVTLSQLTHDNMIKGVTNVLNNAIGNVSANDFSNPIILNRYIQYLVDKNILAKDIGSSSSGNFFGTAITGNSALGNAINNLYFLNNFSSQKQLFFNGDISTGKPSEIGKQLFLSEFYDSIGYFSSNENNGKNVYYLKKSSQNFDFFKFLLGIEYLVNNNNEKFLNYLSDEISYGEQAYVAWVRTDSTNANVGFGTDAATDFSTFRNEAVYLTKLNGYAYMNAPFEIQQNGQPVSGQSSNITYTTDTKYWSSAEFGSAPDTTYYGFYGLQTSESNTLPSILTDGTSNNTNVFSNNVWQNNNTNGTSYNFTGSMYQYGSLNDYITNKIYKPESGSEPAKYLINTISEFQTLVTDFYNYRFDKAANDPSYSDEVDKFLNETLINEASNDLQNAICNFIGFITDGNSSTTSLSLPKPTSQLIYPRRPSSMVQTIPSDAFNQYSGSLYTTNVLGNQKTTIFSNGTDYLGTEIMVEQINSTTIEQAKSNGASAWTTLGITQSAFFSMLVNAAMNPEIQSKAVDIMNNSYAKINVYDARLNNSLPIVILNNYINPNKDKEN